MKKIIGSGFYLEDVVGYSRAIRINNVIEVAGTTALDGNEVTGKDDIYKQSLFIFKKIETAINNLGGKLEDVVRTRMFVTDIANWQGAGKAHGEFFNKIKPVTTMVEVSKLIHPDMLIEIEATAIIDSMAMDN